MLRRLNHHVHVLAVVLHGQQFGSSRQIVVPQIVMDRLEMPQPLSGARVQRDDRIGE
jgi:hypothetical protein